MKLLLTITFIVLTATARAQQTEKLIINFDFDKYNITAQAKQRLDSFLRSKPSGTVQRIDLYGHCDSIGNNSYNDLLSAKRVEAVKEYLVEQGMAENIFQIIKGYGERQPLNQNANDVERRLNRRVEMTVIRKPEEKKVAPSVEIKKVPEQTLAQKIRDTAIKAGSNIILKNINFIGGRHWLVPESRPALQELLQVMQQYPSLEIEIQGHVCCVVGDMDGADIDTHTLDLSVQRARAIYNFLIGNGIDKRRLSYKGFGHKYPLFKEDSEEHAGLNRRVEIKIIKK